MLRALKSFPAIASPQPRRAAQAGLLALSRVAARWAAQLQQVPAARADPVIEFEVLEIGGRKYGARYEDGRLVALLPGVRRL